MISRYDYENVDSTTANTMMSNLRELISNNTLKEQQLGAYIVDDMDDFRYVDPVDESVTENQVCMLAKI